MLTNIKVLFKGMNINFSSDFLRKVVITNKQIACVICSVGASQNKHLNLLGSEY